MIKNKKILEELERNLISKTPPDFEKNLRIFETLLKFAREMGKIPPEDLLEGIENDIKYAEAINGIKRIYKNSGKRD